MKRKLYLIGGIANVVFLLFHLRLGWTMHHWNHVAPPVRGLLEMFNVGGALSVGFLAYASILCTRDMETGVLGRAVAVFAFLVYATRAAGEFIFTVNARPVIVAVTGSMAVLYAVALLLPGRPEASARVQRT